MDNALSWLAKRYGKAFDFPSPPHSRFALLAPLSGAPGSTPKIVVGSSDEHQDKKTTAALRASWQKRVHKLAIGDTPGKVPPARPPSPVQINFYPSVFCNNGSAEMARHMGSDGDGAQRAEPPQLSRQWASRDLRPPCPQEMQRLLPSDDEDEVELSTLNPSRDNPPKCGDRAGPSHELLPEYEKRIADIQASFRAGSDRQSPDPSAASDTSADRLRADAKKNASCDGETRHFDFSDLIDLANKGSAFPEWIVNRSPATAVEREAEAEIIRQATLGTDVLRARFPFARPEVALRQASLLPAPVGTRTFNEMAEIVRVEAMRYIRDADVIDAVNVRVGQSRSWTDIKCIDSCFLSLIECCGCFPTIHDVFSPTGRDFRLLRTKSARRRLLAERSLWGDELIRMATSYSSGAVDLHTLCSRGLGDGKDATAPIPSDTKTRMQLAVEKFKTPTVDEATQIMSKRANHSHPLSAAVRYLTITRLRKFAKELGYSVYDPSVSSNKRDSGTFGPRDLHNLKDLGHLPRACPNGHEPGNKILVSLIDHLGNGTDDADTLRPYAGHDMMIWATRYPALAGTTEEATYYATGVRSFTEVVGKNGGNLAAEMQCPWHFTKTDIVYVENEDRTSFTVYQVHIFPQPEVLKQVVFLCALQTVNLPYAVVNAIIKATKGHDLDSTGIGTPGPCDNVKLVPRDPSKPFTKDILVMTCGSPEKPIASIKYRGETSPDGISTMSTPVYHWLQSLNSHGGRALSHHEINQRLEKYNETGDLVHAPGASAYCELLRVVGWFDDLPNLVYYGQPSLKAYPDSGGVPSESASAKAVLAAPNITMQNPGVLAQDKKALQMAVKQKLTDVANKVDPPQSWKKISGVAERGFFENIAKKAGIKPGTLQLVDREEVLAARTKAVQKARLVTDGLGPCDEGNCEAATKREVVAKVKTSARVVQSPTFNVSVASAVLGKSLEQVLKKQDWYCPGLNPEQMAESVRRYYILSGTLEAGTGAGRFRGVDYKSADAKHSEFSNGYLRRFIEFIFCKDDVGLALQIYDSCFNMDLQVADAVKSTGWTNASGTGITTVLNTFVFALRELLTIMLAMVFKSIEDAGGIWCDFSKCQGHMCKDGTFPEITHATFLEHVRIIQKKWDLQKHVNTQNFLSPGKAKIAKENVLLVDICFALIGPKYGDDGLDPATPFVSDFIYEGAMLYVDRADGFERKLEGMWSVLNEERCEFLSRVYPSITTSLCCYANVIKALNKLSVAVNRDKDRYFLKLQGYWSTDRKTPILGPYMTAIANLYKFDLGALDRDALLAKLYDADRDTYWKVAAGPHPYDAGSEELMYQVIASDFGLSSVELHEYDEKLASMSTWNGIKTMMLPWTLEQEKLMTLGDPLGLHLVAETPEGVARVPPIDGGDVRMEAFGPPPPALAGSVSAERAKALQEIFATDSPDGRGCRNK